jgi:acyl carrier protein
MTEPILAAVEETMRRIFRDPSLRVGMDTTAEDVDGWDSLAHARLIVALENQFSVSFPARRLFEIGSVGELVELIAACRGDSRQ